MVTRTSYRCELMSRTEAPLGLLEGASGVALAFSVASTIKSSGQVTVTRAGQQIDLLNDRIKIVATVDGVDHPLGVFLFQVPESSYQQVRIEGVFELQDKLSALDASTIPGIFSLAAGSNVIAKVKELIEGAGESAVSITPSAATLRGNATWDVGTSRLRIINDLLDAANYFSLWCDGEGRYQATPYVDAQNRPLAAVLEDGKTAIYSPNFVHRKDVWKIPNRFIAVSRSGEDEPAIIGIATNENPDSPFSYQSRGRWIDDQEQDLVFADQAAANAYAQRRLQEVSSASSTIEIEHAFLPLQLNDAVYFSRQLVRESMRLAGRYVVQRMEVNLSTPAFLTKTTLREVMDV